MIVLNILKVKKMVLQIVLIRILQKSELVHIILYLLKKYWLVYWLIHKGLYKDKSITEYICKWMFVYYTYILIQLTFLKELMLINQVKSMNLSDIAILNIKAPDYWCIVSGISKNEAISQYKIPIWPQKVEHYKI